MEVVVVVVVVVKLHMRLMYLNQWMAVTVNSMMETFVFHVFERRLNWK